MSTLIDVLFFILLGWAAMSPFMVLPAWLIARRAGLAPELSLVAAIPYFGLVAFAWLLALSRLTLPQGQLTSTPAGDRRR
jgi:hypothetical protein